MMEAKLSSCGSGGKRLDSELSEKAALPATETKSRAQQAICCFFLPPDIQSSLVSQEL